MTKLRFFCVSLVSVAPMAFVGCGSSDVQTPASVGGTAGTVGSGGAAGTSGSGGATMGDGGGGDGGSGDSGPSDCVDFSHAEPVAGRPRDLLVIGTALDDFEGDRVRLVITNNAPKYGLAETVVSSGSFELALPGGVGNYTGLGLYIDRGKDDACTLDLDPVWQWTTGGDHGPVTWEVNPSSMGPDVGIPPCNINGIFDLTTPLPCPG